MCFRSSCTSVSPHSDTKYLPEGFRLTVAFTIRPFTSRLLAIEQGLSFGNLILFPVQRQCFHLFGLWCKIVRYSSWIWGKSGAYFVFEKSCNASARWRTDDESQYYLILWAKQTLPSWQEVWQSMYHMLNLFPGLFVYVSHRDKEMIE